MVCFAQWTPLGVPGSRMSFLASFNASLDDEDYEVPSSALGRIGSLKAPLSSVQWWA